MFDAYASIGAMDSVWEALGLLPSGTLPTCACACAYTNESLLVTRSMEGTLWTQPACYSTRTAS